MAQQSLYVVAQLKKTGNPAEFIGGSLNFTDKDGNAIRMSVDGITKAIMPRALAKRFAHKVDIIGDASSDMSNEQLSRNSGLFPANMPYRDILTGLGYGNVQDIPADDAALLDAGLSADQILEIRMFLEELLNSTPGPLEE